MYENHFGLTRKPFSIVPNPEILFLSKNHANALTYLEYGLSEKVGFILLTGDIGTGKTTLVRHMLLKMDQQLDVAVIFNTNFSPDQLFRMILNEFEVPCDAPEKERHLELLYQFLIDRYAKRRNVLLIIDEAQNLSDTSLEDIRMLSNLQTDDRILLQIMLVGQPELKAKLQMPKMRQLSQRIAVNYHLTPLSPEQTREYIAYRVSVSGGATDLFSAEAITLIHENAGGIPRTINLLCDSALVYAYADDLKQIDRRVIDQVLKDQTCLSATPQLPVAASQYDGSGSGGASAQTGDLYERIAVVETTLADLTRRHDDLAREVKHELLFKYQELLISERKRYDQLLVRYTHLLRRYRDAENEGQENPGDEPAAAAREDRREGRESEEPRRKGLFGRIWKREDRGWG